MSREQFHQWWLEEFYGFYGPKVAIAVLLALIAILIVHMNNTWRRKP